MVVMTAWHADVIVKLDYFPVSSAMQSSIGLFPVITGPIRGVDLKNRLEGEHHMVSYLDALRWNRSVCNNTGMFVAPNCTYCTCFNNIISYPVHI